jgi:glycosyltransferase involved in cell wall biosynthesis
MVKTPMSAFNPKVSVLLPVRDAAETLPASLQSLLSQTFDDFEVVAVDDGSQDASGDILRSAAQADHRIRVLTSQDRGLVAALNLAFGEARSDLIARMDADDIAHPTRLARQHARLVADESLDILGSRVLCAGAPGLANAGMQAYVTWTNRLLTHEDIVGDLWIDSPLVHPSVMLRRSTLLALGGWRDFDGPEDYDLWLRAYSAGRRFGKLAETLLTWRDSSGRLTRTDPRYAALRFIRLKIERLRDRLLPPGREVAIWGAGPIGKALARELKAQGHALAAFVEVDPRKLGNRVWGAPVITIEQATELRGALHLAAVGQPGARERIRAELKYRGLVEGTNAVVVA